MAFREIVAPTVKELFVQQLEGMILSGELRPGDRLPTERELADEMKIRSTRDCGSCTGWGFWTSPPAGA